MPPVACNKEKSSQEREEKTKIYLACNKEKSSQERERRKLKFTWLVTP
jgi:hypothetical protein